MTTLLDNKGLGKIGDVLGGHSSECSCFHSFTSFFHYGYSALKKQLDRINSIRLLIPSINQPKNSEEEQTFRVAGLMGGNVDRRFRNSLNMVELARECSDWLTPRSRIMLCIVARLICSGVAIPSVPMKVRHLTLEKLV